MANKPLKTLTFPGLDDTYTIPQVDDTLTIQGGVADAKATGDALNAKADTNGVYSEMYAGNLLSTIHTTNQEPYTFRAIPEGAGDREYLSVVGGSLGWNQLVADSGSSLSVTVQNGHKYFMNKDGTKTIGASNGTAITGLTGGTDTITDLTFLFGSTIADYIYTLEQATAGAGVAWLRKYCPKLFEYNEYDAGSIQSVEGLESHDAVGFNQLNPINQILGGYNISVGSAIDSSSPSAVANGTNPIDVVCGSNWASTCFVSDKLVFGETYKADYVLSAATPSGIRATTYLIDDDYTVVEKLRVTTNSGTFSDTFTASKQGLRFAIYVSSNSVQTIRIEDLCVHFGEGQYEPYEKHSYPLDSTITLRGIPKLDSDHKLYFDGDVYPSDGRLRRKCGERAYQSGDESLADAITDGTTTVYKLTTPTTETAQPFISPQICDAGGTEEFVSDSLIPVGSIAEYPADLRKQIENLYGVPEPPTTNGAYKLRATVSGGKPTFSWVSDS